MYWDGICEENCYKNRDECVKCCLRLLVHLKGKKKHLHCEFLFYAFTEVYTHLYLAIKERKEKRFVKVS